MKILLTGASGFFGEHMLSSFPQAWSVYTLGRTPISDVNHICHDFRAPLPARILNKLEGVDYIIHNGAEVHGLRSLSQPELFVENNAMGTFNMLEAARVLKPKKFIYISSAEAIGAVPMGESALENSVLRPSNPYAASKAAGEMLVKAYTKSFGVPANIIRTMNIFGSWQKADKFVPMVIKTILDGQPVKMHITATGIPGSRCWLHIREFVRGLHWILDNGRVGETYHIAGPEKSNAEIIERLVLAIDVPFRLQPVIPGPSHDMRYAIADTKLPPEAYDRNTVEQDLADTARWYKANPWSLL